MVLRGNIPIPLPRVQGTVLLTLGYHGPMTRYEIMIKNRSIAYPVIYITINRLRKYGLVNKVGEGIGKKGARTVILNLSPRGTFYLVGFMPVNFDRLAENKKGPAARVFLPLRRWDYFKSKNCSELLRKAWIAASRAALLKQYRWEEFGEVITRAMIAVGEKDPEQNQRFRNALLSDDELAESYLTTFREQVEELREQGEKLQRTLTTEQDALERFEAKHRQTMEKQRTDGERQAVTNGFYKSVKVHTKDHKTKRTNQHSFEHAKENLSMTELTQADRKLMRRLRDKGLRRDYERERAKAKKGKA